KPRRARRPGRPLAPAPDRTRAARRPGAARGGGEPGRPDTPRPRARRRRLDAHGQRVAGRARRAARRLSVRGRRSLARDHRVLRRGLGPLRPRDRRPRVDDTLRHAGCTARACSRARPSGRGVEPDAGGGGGDGAAPGRRRDGADVAFIYRRDAAAAAEVEARVRALGRRCLPLQADLGEPVAVAAALDRLAAETDHVDVLVANAAATAFKPLLEVKPHHVEKTYAISVGAFLQMVQRIAPRMPGGGRIVTISGMDTHRYVAGHGVLASAKAALEA